MHKHAIAFLTAAAFALAPTLAGANPVVVVHPSPPPMHHHFHGHGFGTGPAIAGAMIGCAAIFPIVDSAIIKRRELTYREADGDIFSCLIPIPFVGYMIGDWIGQQNELALAQQNAPVPSAWHRHKRRH